MLFAQFVYRDNGSAAEKPEISDLILNPLIHKLSNDPVEELRRVALEKTIAVARRPLGRHNVVALIEQFEHLRQEFGRVLEIRIHHSDGIAGREIESCRDCRLMAEITAEENDFQERIRRRGVPERFGGSVGTSVIDENQLVMDMACQSAPQRRQQRRQYLKLVINRNDDRK